MLDIPEKHVGHRENIGNSQGKEEGRRHDNREKQHCHTQRNPKENQDRRVGNTGVPEIDQRRHAPGQRENLHGKLYLDQHLFVVHQARHRRVGCCGEELKDNISREIVNRVIFDAPPEHSGENG